MPKPPGSTSNGVPSVLDTFDSRLDAFDTATDPDGDPASAVLVTETPFVTGRFRLRDRWSAKDFGARFNGDDETTELQEAVLEAGTAGRALWLPEGEVAVSAQITPGGNPGSSTSTIVEGAGVGKTVIYQDFDGRVLNCGQALGTAIDVTEDLSIGEREIGCDDTTDFAAGDWVEIRSTALFPGTTKDAVVGEFARVQTIDSATALTLRGPLEESYLLADSPTIRKVPMIEGVVFRNFTIDNPNQGTYVNQLEAIRLNQTAGAVIENVDFKHLDNTAIKVSDSVDWAFDRLRFFDSTNDDINDRFGYGVAAFNATRNGVLSRSFMNRGRHLFTTGGTATRSVPKHITVSNCHGTNMDSTPFDTHEEGRWVTFSGCKATNCTSNAFSARAPDTIFVAPEALSTDRGIVITATGHRSKVFGGSLRQITRQITTTAYGIHVQGDDVEIYWPSIDLTDDIGIEVTGARCKVWARVSNPGQVGTSSCVRFNGGDGHTVNGHFSDATNGVQATSAVTNLALGTVTHRNVTTALNLNPSVTFRRTYFVQGMQTIATDAAFALTPETSPEQTLHTGTLTADRAVTLNTTGAVRGLKYRISRSGSGAFNLNVGTGPLKALATGEWCEVAYDGSAWVLTAFGSL